MKNRVAVLHGVNLDALDRRPAEHYGGLTFARLEFRIEQYAKELGLDMNRFKAALDSNKFDAQIAAEQAEAGRVGADGTPTFFINGRQLVGAQPVDQFKAIIDEELKKAK